MSTTHSIIDRKGEKNSKDLEELKNTIDLICIYMRLHLIIAECTFFSITVINLGQILLPFCPSLLLSIEFYIGKGVFQEFQGYFLASIFSIFSPG